MGRLASDHLTAGLWKCLLKNTDAWPAYYAGLYFPPGAYRICGPIEMPFLRHVHILGAGGRGGVYGAVDGTAPNFVLGPLGTVIVQHVDGAPIFRFRHGDCQDVTIEGVGFRWKNQQEPPPDWAWRPSYRDDLPAGYTDPGAVAILFSGGLRQLPAERDEGYYHFRITRCHFERGFGGIAIDDTFDENPVAVWDTQIDHCHFSQMTGSAISLVNHPAQFIGMPGNAISHCFVENYNRLEGGLPAVGSVNAEEQVRLAAQSGMTIRNLDAEGSKFRVLYAADCVMAVNGLHVEHVEVVGLYPLLFYIGGGTCGIHGVNVDGLMLALNDESDPENIKPSFSTIFRGDGQARVTLSGVRVRPIKVGGDLAEDFGFAPLNGECVLVHTNVDFGGGATFHLLDQPDMPVYITRGQLVYDGTPVDYRELRSWSDFAGATRLTSAVETTPVKALRTLAFPSIDAGDVAVLLLGDPDPPLVDDELHPVPGARPGDLVTLGPPANLPAGLFASGVVPAPNQVEIRLFNATGATVNPPSGAWTIAVGGGPGGGLAQFTPTPPVIDAWGHSIPPA